MNTTDAKLNTPAYKAGVAIHEAAEQAATRVAVTVVAVASTGYAAVRDFAQGLWSGL